MRGGRIVFAVACAAALSGCALAWYPLKNPGQDQVVRVESGDRYYFTLEEDSAKGFSWTAKSDDKDVEVVIDHIRPSSIVEKGKAKVRIRIMRGYDGPSTVDFVCRRSTGEKSGSFVLTFYRRTYDAASWE